MATKTLILRPTGIASSGGGFSRYPTDTAQEDSYLLVNETNADDDATYLQSTSSITSIHFLFNIPSEYITITPKKIYITLRVKTASSNSAYSPQITIYTNTDSDGDGNNDKEYIKLKVTNYDMYETYTEEIQHITDLWSNILNGESTILLYSLYKSDSSSTSTKNIDIRLTQLYLEVQYDDEESERSMFIKQDNTWISTEGIIYKKKNNQWVLSDLSIFQNEDRFNIKII